MQTARCFQSVQRHFRVFGNENRKKFHKNTSRNTFFFLIYLFIIALWCKHTKGLLVTCTNSRESTLHYITYLPTYLYQELIESLSSTFPSLPSLSRINPGAAYLWHDYYVILYPTIQLLLYKEYTMLRYVRHV